MATAVEYVQALLDREEYARQVTGHRILEEEPAHLAATRRPLPRALQDVLTALGVPGLYSHQAEALDLVRQGRDVVVTTPTASGKTLTYNLPFLERRLEDPDATALYLFPLKALAQDQKKSLDALTLHWPEHARPTVALYDGDTPEAQRTKIRKQPPAVLITNPEMLHLGILPHHERWTTFLASLSLVVLDEAHIYRGVFGAHMACILQRLARVARRYNAHPVHVLCTATLGNPGQLGRLLLGSDTDPCVVSRSGAPRGRRHMLFMEPETSPATLAINLLKAALARRLRTIVYCRSRRMTELVSLWASQQAGPIARRISAYRAGYLPEERRQIEARMASGDLLAVVSTSALELGIDIGALDVCILVGYPGSIMATLQRGGRVGRKGQESCVLLIGGEDALDQYFVHNPEQFFARPPESAMLNPDNPVILSRHLECAAAESPLVAGEPWLRREAVAACLTDLERTGTLLRSADGRLLLAARKRPQRSVSLRGSGTSFQIVDPEGHIIGSVDAHQAFRETHEGAVYLHRGRSYVIDKLDLGSHTALTRPKRVHWHTSVRTSKSTEILSTRCRGTVFGMPVYLGRLKVTEQVTGFERRDNGSRRLLDIQPLELPPQVFETEGLWMCIPEEARLKVEEQFYHFMGSIHALEHVSIGLMPLLVMADRNDFGGISIPMHLQVGGPAVFVYDGLPGGAGLCAGAYRHLDELILSVHKTLVQCPCETGCPSCIQSPKCGSGNRPLDKQGALCLVECLLARRDEGMSFEEVIEVAEATEAASAAGTAGVAEAAGELAAGSDEAVESGGTTETRGTAGTAEEQAWAWSASAAVAPEAAGEVLETASGTVSAGTPRSRGTRQAARTNRAARARRKLARDEADDTVSAAEEHSGQEPGPEADPESDLPSGARTAGTEAAEDILVDPFSGERIVFAGSGEEQAQADDGPHDPNDPDDPNGPNDPDGPNKPGEPDRSAAAARGLPSQAAAESNPASAAAPKPVRRPGSLLDFLSAADRAKSRDNRPAAGTGSRRAARAGTAAPVPGAGSAQAGTKTGTRTGTKTGSQSGREADTGPDTATAVQPAVQAAVPPIPSAPVPPARPRQRRDYGGPVVFFDVETRRSAAEVGGWQHAERMGVSVVVCWDGSAYRSFAQEELGAFFALLRTAGLVVGFNSFRFDYKVLQPFAGFDLHKLKGLDILAEIYKYLHYRVSLDNVGMATLGRAKSSDGMQALAWWKKGEIDKIRAYCQQDVAITRGLFEFGQEHGYVLFANKAGQRVRIPVSW